ncbi:hypothetical protein Hanom_Chr06g00564991 [Helianthus anomalus]
MVQDFKRIISNSDIRNKGLQRTKGMFRSAQETVKELKTSCLAKFRMVCFVGGIGPFEGPPPPK